MRLKKFETFIKESTGDIDKQYLEIKNQYSNVDFKQIPGGVELSSHSDTDIYNIKKVLGGEVTIDNGLYILHIKDKV